MAAIIEEERNSQHSRIPENQTSVADMSHWTVINDVPDVSLLQSTLNDGRKRKCFQHLAIKTEFKSEKTVIGSTEGVSWANINVKTEPGTFPIKMETSDAYVNTEIDDHAFYITNIKTEPGGYSFTEKTVEENNGQNKGCKTVNSNSEKNPQNIESKPEADAFVKCESRAVAYDTSSDQMIEDMIIGVVKEESCDELLTNKVSDNPDGCSLLLNNGRSSPPETLQPVSEGKPVETTNVQNTQRKLTRSKQRKPFSTKRHGSRKFFSKKQEIARRIRCWLCKELLKDKIMLNTHLKDCHKIQEETTDISTYKTRLTFQQKKKRFTGKTQLESDAVPVKEQENFSPGYECKPCDRKFLSRGNFMQHRRWHFRLKKEGITPPNDTDPAKETNDRANVQQNEESKTQIQELSSVNKEPDKWEDPKSKHLLEACHVCNKEIRKTSMPRHMKLHSTDPNARPIKCPKCDKRYIEKRDMHMHFLRNHPDTVDPTINPVPSSVQSRLHKKYPCSKCAKVYTTKTNLKLHDEGVHLNRFECHNCGCKFYNDYNLQRHIRTCGKDQPGVRRDNLSFKCDDCDKSFTTKYSLQKHMARFHSSETPFKCEFCLKEFKTRSNLAMHVKRLHRIGKSNCIQCTKCSRRFSSNEELDVHCSMFRFVCPICPQHFIRVVELKQHVLKHRKR